MSVESKRLDRLIQQRREKDAEILAEKKRLKARQQKKSILARQQKRKCETKQAILLGKFLMRQFQQKKLDWNGFLHSGFNQFLTNDRDRKAFGLPPLEQPSDETV